MKLLHIITEGMIQLPPELSRRCMRATQQAVLSTCLNQINAVDIKGKEKAAQAFRNFVKQQYPGVQLHSHINMFSAGDVKPYDIPEQYHHFLAKQGPYDFNKETSLRVIFISDVEDGTGEYDVDTNTISLSMKWYLTFRWDLYVKSIIRQDDTIDAELSRYKETESELLRRVEQRLWHTLGDLKHELAHYMQFKVLVRGSEEQIGNDNPKSSDEYVNSQVEFDPQIKSAIGITMGLYKRLSNYGQIDNHNLAAFLCAAAPRETVLTGNPQIDKLIPTTPLSPFKELKISNPVQWKRAVKYYMGQLQS